MKRSKIIYAVAAWLLANAALSTWLIATSRGALDSPDKLQNIVGVVLAATVGVGLLRHRRWAMWLYFIYAAVGLALFLFGGGAEAAARRGPEMVGLALAAVIIPAILIWFRRDRLDPAPSERPNA